jgi:hypothetical protein
MNPENNSLHGASVPLAPEQTFFRDPTIDRLLGVVFNLAIEVQVLRDRLASMEMLLVRGRIIAEGELDGFRPDASQDAALAAQSRAFVADLLTPLLGQQASRSEGDCR